MRLFWMGSYRMQKTMAKAAVTGRVLLAVIIQAQACWSWVDCFTINH